MTLQLQEIESTIMEVASAATTRAPAATGGHPGEPHQPATEPAAEIADRAKGSLRGLLDQLGSDSDFAREVVADIVEQARLDLLQGKPLSAILEDVRAELRGLKEALASPNEASGREGEVQQVDVGTEGELESLDEQAALAWVQVSDGVRVKCELPPELFEGAGVEPGHVFVIDVDGKARPVETTPVPPAEQTDSVVRSLLERERAYRDKPRHWRVAAD